MIDAEACIKQYLFRVYGETSIYHSQMYNFSESIVECQYSLNKSYLKYGPHMYRFPVSIGFSGPPTKKINLGFTVLQSSRSGWINISA
jgi:hypothetical protein